MEQRLPPGPRWPSAIQTVLFLRWPFPFVRDCRRRYGDVFTLNLAGPGQVAPGPIVYLADVTAIKELFALDGRDGHAGAANAILEPLTGSHSILLLDRDEHVRERRLLSPGFHGDALGRLVSVIHEATERELASWATDSVFAVRPAMQRITFEVIVRAVLGIEDEALRKRLLGAFEPLFDLSPAQAASLAPALQVDLGRWSPWGRFRRARERLDELLLELIAERRSSEQKADILGLLLASTDMTGEPLSDHHVRDELVTLLIAGHETTATALAWAFERLAQNPGVATTVRDRLAQDDDAILDAVAAETLRVRPVVMDVARQLSAEVELAGFRLPAGTTVMPAIYLVQLDAKNHDAPEAFDPERFAGRRPSPATWLPFGGGRRRCLGASLAQAEMRIVLGHALRHYIPESVAGRAERPKLRGITFTPEHGARLRMRRSALVRA